MLIGNHVELIYMFFFAPEQAAGYEEMDNQLVINAHNDEAAIN
jgi:hypothetical protein